MSPFFIPLVDLCIPDTLLVGATETLLIQKPADKLDFHRLAGLHDVSVEFRAWPVSLRMKVGDIKRHEVLRVPQYHLGFFDRGKETLEVFWTGRWRAFDGKVPSVSLLDPDRSGMVRGDDVVGKMRHGPCVHALLFHHNVRFSDVALQQVAQGEGSALITDLIQVDQNFPAATSIEFPRIFCTLFT